MSHAPRRRRIGVAFPSALVLAMVLAALPSSAAAHPLGNYTVNRAVVIEIGASVEVRYVVDMAEIPAFEAIAAMDRDGNGDVAEEEAAESARERCATVQADLEIVLDGRRTQPRQAAAPRLDFPPGAGGLPTLRLECRFTVAEPSPGDPTEQELTVRDLTDDTRSGWREVTALALPGASILAADVPAQSDSAVLTAYPEGRLEAPPDVRAGTVRFRLAPQAVSAVAGPGDGPVATRPTASDPLADLVGGGLSPALVGLAMLLSLGLGALHALSPGHGKTLVAAYVLGAGGDARSAMLIGLSVAASHTAGVLVLGIVTLVAGRLFVPERVLAWLSLGSGIVVAGLGAMLLLRVLARRGRSHRHDHEHPHDHHRHDHQHPEPASGGITWRSALALGFAGGAVPSASAVIVLLVAISTDRLLFGSVLIATFGIGMAVVLGGLALAVARIGRVASSSSRWLASPVIRRAGALVPAAAGIAVLATGITFTLAAVGRLA